MTLHLHVVSKLDHCSLLVDAKLNLFNHEERDKASNVRLVDVALDVNMGRIELVFLMKFINDFLAFIEPFSGAIFVYIFKICLHFQILFTFSKICLHL